MGLALCPVAMKWFTWMGDSLRTGKSSNTKVNSKAPSIPSTWLNRVPVCPAGVKAGRVYLCRVADNTG